MQQTERAKTTPGGLPEGDSVLTGPAETLAQKALRDHREGGIPLEKAIKDAVSAFVSKPEARQLRAALLHAVSAAVQVQEEAEKIAARIGEKVFAQIPQLQDRSSLEVAVAREVEALLPSKEDPTVCAIRAKVMAMIDGRLRKLTGTTGEGGSIDQQRAPLSSVDYAKQHIVGKVVVVQRGRPSGQKAGKRLSTPARAVVTEARAWERIGDSYADYYRNRPNRRVGEVYGKYLVLGVVSGADSSNPRLVTITKVRLPGGKVVPLGTFLKDAAGYSSNNVQFMDGETPGPEATIDFETAEDADQYEPTSGRAGPDGSVVVQLNRKES